MSAVKVKVPSLEPQGINEHNWYYEEASGIVVVHEVRNKDGSYVRTDTINIPWSSLVTSAIRCGLVIRRKRTRPTSGQGRKAK